MYTLTFVHREHRSGAMLCRTIRLTEDSRSGTTWFQKSQVGLHQEGRRYIPSLRYTKKNLLTIGQ